MSNLSELVLALTWGNPWERNVARLLADENSDKDDDDPEALFD
jgi:hypothetical protein